MPSAAAAVSLVALDDAIPAPHLIEAYGLLVLAMSDIEHPSPPCVAPGERCALDLTDLRGRFFALPEHWRRAANDAFRSAGYPDRSIGATCGQVDALAAFVAFAEDVT